ncbi:MAG: DUF4956 domain-containing protein [Bifidobacteriaceae bacterium]|jgi:hypothetical protein|nr:DUF4956 domain-containing protein [Bifidobacteriaceae bacterium]
MFDIILPLADCVCIGVLVLALYFPRHRRRDLVAAFLAVNVGVMAVAAALAATSVNVGLGLGLFGVLALIRLRSAELRQHEIAYYFASLALGLIGGLAAPMGWAAVAFMGAIVLTLALADWRGAARADRSRVVVLPGLHPEGPSLDQQLSALLGPGVVGAAVRKLDAVRGETTLAVRFASTGQAGVGLAGVGQAGVGQAGVGQPDTGRADTSQPGWAGQDGPPARGQDGGEVRR